MNTKIKTLSQILFERQNNEHKPYILLLGAGASIRSECLGWPELCKLYCEKHSITPDDVDYIAAFRKQKINKLDTYLAFAKSLSNKEPSIGYYHLANLIKQRVFETIITTNFDNLLEKTLANMMPIDEIKVLIRGEVTDEYITNFIKEGVPKIKIIKLHGDLQSNIFFYKDKQDPISLDLQNVLKDSIKNGSIIVGHEMEDDDLLAIYNGNDAYNYFINPQSPNNHLKTVLKLDESTIIINTTNEHITNENDVEIIETDGEFDTFFTKLNLEFQKNVINEKINERKEIEKIILADLKNNIEPDQLERMVKNFWHNIKETYDEEEESLDMVVFIDDPSVSGGMELKKLMTGHIKNDYENITIETVKIEGEQPVRSYNRKVTSLKPDLKLNNKNILILDAISFSGNTLKIAIQKYKEWFSNCKIRGGIMMVYDQLLENIKNDNDIKNIIYCKTTNQHEMLFPWGVTQATYECTRKFKGKELVLDSVYPITTQRRPWGTVEILTKQQNCSVRILTIEANQELSFQRHLARDEFLVALDADIGLNIWIGTQDGSSTNDINNIERIKKLVLKKDDCVLIPRGIWHRMKSVRCTVRLLEIGYGVYDQEKDIERIDDRYGRTKLDGRV